MIKKVILFGLYYLFCYFYSINLEAKDNRPRLSLGVGQFNFMEDGTGPYNKTSEMMNIEIYSGKKLFKLIKPFAGFLGTTAGTYYAYGGFGIDGYYTKKKNIYTTL